MSDASPFYAILRYEEASLALRAALKLNVVERLGDRQLTINELQNEFHLTQQASEIFSMLLLLMDVLERVADAPERLQATERARLGLAASSEMSRKAYLSMGSSEAVEELIDLMQGNARAGLPLYAGGETASLMEAQETAELAEEVAMGLASRAKCFAPRLARFIASHAPEVRSIADLGAGSPYLALELAQLLPDTSSIQLVDQPAGLKFAKQISSQVAQKDPAKRACLERLAYVSADFFSSVPEAELYCLSNTAHDWLPDQYELLIRNIVERCDAPPQIVIHEPLMIDHWETDAQWRQALWMACYALTLFKLTNGQGTCYTLEQHDHILQGCGFERKVPPETTADGCTALLYSRI